MRLRPCLLCLFARPMLAAAVVMKAIAALFECGLIFSQRARLTSGAPPYPRAGSPYFAGAVCLCSLFHYLSVPSVAAGVAVPAHRGALESVSRESAEPERRGACLGCAACTTPSTADLSERAADLIARVSASSPVTATTACHCRRRPVPLLRRAGSSHE